ncbi:hypothetical protein PPYR_14570 [Photinus pyralis]|uniref:Transcription initiation protein SPT3 homolog n=4 Tax=Photinus pyralis TaxID=7054 RepID=A0A5N4A5M7_PHOPY|nr:hypothetical protein PPYR_14570 [Photinus pyralis]
MEPQKVTYCTEISLMMFGFGDSHKPNPETVRFVESIVLRQLRTIVHEATRYWDGKLLGGEELIFLMRKNKWKMRRFVKYLNLKHLKTQCETEMNAEFQTKTPQSRHPLLEFIERIDETGELTDLSELDEVIHRRQVRADCISQALDDSKYLEFQKARCVSFNSRGTSRSANLEKLRAWIDPKKQINTSGIALEVLAYYAYQTVAEIIDYALLVRMDARRSSDPLGNLAGLHYTAAMFVGEHRFSGSNPDYSRVYSGQPPITVAEIREVMRRFNVPQAGRLTFGGRLPETSFLFAL